MPVKQGQLPFPNRHPPPLALPSAFGEILSQNKDIEIERQGVIADLAHSNGQTSPSQWQLTLEDLDELQKLIERKVSQKRADGRDARTTARHLPHGGAVLQRLHDAEHPGSEFIRAVGATALLQEGRALAVRFDEQRNDSEQRTEQDECECRYRDVESALGRRLQEP